MWKNTIEMRNLLVMAMNPELMIKRVHLSVCQLVRQEIISEQALQHLDINNQKVKRAMDSVRHAVWENVLVQCHADRGRNLGMELLPREIREARGELGVVVHDPSLGFADTAIIVKRFGATEVVKLECRGGAVEAMLIWRRDKGGNQR